MGQSAVCSSRYVRYSALIHSARWKRLRDRKLRDAGYRCEKCGKCTAMLEIHHLTYRRLGHEWLTDLIVLCQTCHDQADGNIVNG